MKISIKTLEKHNACTDGLEWLKEQGTLDLCEVVKRAIKQGEKTMNYANWGITRLMNHKQQVQYAVFAARQVLKIYEDKYPDDKRPRKAIEAVEKYIKDPTSENQAAASAAAAYAADAAARAADAADAAALAAARAAYAAAYAAYAADAAARAADAAAYAADAADAAVKLCLKAKILRYGVKLLMEDKKI